MEKEFCHMDVISRNDRKSKMEKKTSSLTFIPASPDVSGIPPNPAPPKKKTKRKTQYNFLLKITLKLRFRPMFF